jgi:hypothetical protein
LPIAIAYRPEAALNPHADAAATTIRAVAAQVRRQVPRDPDSLALTLPALIDACRIVEVNGRRLAVSWDLGRALHGEDRNAVLGLCGDRRSATGHIDADEPGLAYIAVNGPMTVHRPDLALSTAAHELAHLLFDVPAAVARGEQRYHAVARSPRALDRLGRGAEARANEFMGALLAPAVPLHTRLTGPTHITVRVPLRIRQRPGRKTIVTPVVDGLPTHTTTRADPTLLKALARAFRYQRMLDSGKYTTIGEMAAGEKLDRGYLGRLLQLTLLAPEPKATPGGRYIVEAIVEGRQSEGVTLPRLMAGVPASWEEQRLSYRQG